MNSPSSCSSSPVLAEPVPVRFAEGIVHGFLSLRTADGALVANGDLIQVARGDRVTSRLVFHFKDGSLRDETSVFSQRQNFRLISNRLVQKGPTFPQPLDLRIDCATGQVTVHYTDDHGKDKVESERMKLPPDLANGMTLTLLKNVPAKALPPSMSMVVATPKPRLVKLEVSEAGEDSLSTGTMARKATHYVVEDRDRRPRRTHRAPRRQTAAGHPRLDSRRRGAACLREIGWSHVSRRTDLAHGARQPRVAIRTRARPRPLDEPVYGTEIDSPATAGVWTGRRRACVACSKL